MNLRSLAAFAVLCCAIASGVSASRADSPLPPGAIASVDEGNYRLTITRARWFMPNVPKYFPGPERLLSLHYNLTRIDDGTGMHAGDLKDNLKLRAYNPDHFDSYKVAHAGDGYTMLTGVKPGGQPIILDFLLIGDPLLTANQTGESDSQVSFADVPLDTAAQALKQANLRYYGAFGSTISLAKVNVEPQTRIPSFVVAITEPAKGTITTDYDDRITVTGEQGQAVGGTWSMTRDDATHWHFAGSDALSGDVRSLRIVFDIAEINSAVATDGMQVHFRFVLPQKSIEPAMTATKTAPLATVSNPQLTGSIERFFAYFRDYVNTSALIFLRPANPSPGVTWLVDSATASDDDGDKIDTAVTLDQFWHTSGIPATSGETGADIAMKFTQPPRTGVPVAIVVTARPYQRIEEDLRFDAIPIPDARQSEDVGATPDSDANSALKLVRVVRVSVGNVKSIPGLVAAGAIPGQLALVFEYPAVTGERTSLVGLAALDDQKTWLELDHLQIEQPVNASVVKGGVWQFVYLLDVPSASATTFNMTMHIDDRIPTGDPVTLRFASIPLRATLN